MNAFSAKTYQDRRKDLKKKLQSGLILLIGNSEASMNYPDNHYRFRQDSNFYYYFGINEPDLMGVMDIDADNDILIGDDQTVEHIIWTGPSPDMAQKMGFSGANSHLATKNIKALVDNALAKGQKIHYLPPYRADALLKLADLLNTTPDKIKQGHSMELIKAVINQRSIKSTEEIEEMSKAVDISKAMHEVAMKSIKPGKYEYEIVAEIYKTAKIYNSYLAYPAIFSVNGQTLHNHYHGNQMQSGRLLLNDSGAEGPTIYSGDITRTIPVSGKFTSKQKEIYNTVLEMENTVIESLKPGITYKSMHLLANRILLTNLKQLGLLRGDIETMLELGVGGLFMPHGLGHMIGLDVHDMEDLGEDLVGYDESMERSTQLGLKSLRLAKQLQAGFTLTVEPGIYFIPDLIEKWKSEGKFTEFIEFEKLKEYYDFGGIRIEDNVLITNNSYKVLGEPIPKTIAEIEAIMA